MGGSSRSDRPIVHRLPAAFSSFLGRGREMSEIRQLLQASRLVTLTGAPGIGKSRLAREVAGRADQTSRDSPALVELAPIGDPALIPRALAAAVSVQEAPGRTMTEALVAHLRQRSVLLVLDNCEHLLGACAELVDALLSGCPQLRVLATSREPLSMCGEQVWQVPPLSVPDASQEPLPEALMGYEAVRLFVERAGAAQPDFVLSREVAPAVAEITRRLDGISLAIELAATRVEMLTPAEITRRLDDRFSLLTKGSRSGLARHQTLLAALDWSHELLSAGERVLLRRLSVFVGGFCFEAAESVCAGGDIEAGEIFDLLAGLVSKSLVVSDTANSRGRYGLLETIRAYAADRLEEADEAPALGEAHARFYLALAERAEPELTGPEQERWFERLDSERENLRFALHWSLGHGQVEWALRLAGALVLFWRVRCHFSEGRELLKPAVQASDGKDYPSALRAKALWGVGFMTVMLGDFEGALPALEESLSRFRELGDRQGCARALLLLGNGRMFRADPAVQSLLEESATLAREAGDSWCLAHALGVAGLEHAAMNNLPAARPLLEEGVAVARQAKDMQGVRYGQIVLGRVAVTQGDYRFAESILEEAQVLTQELGEDLGRAVALEHLGHLALGRGDYGRAQELLDQALSLFPELTPPNTTKSTLLLLGRAAYALGDHTGARRRLEEVEAAIPGATWPEALQFKGELAVDEGDPSEARRAFEQARDRAQHIGDKWGMARALEGLGHLARDSGNTSGAAALHNDALGLRRQIGDAPGIAASLEALAGLAAVAGRHPHAARLLGAAQALRDANGYARGPQDSSRHESNLALIRQALSAQDFEAAVTQGGRLSMDEVLAQVSKGRGRRGRPPNGWASLTDAEQQVAELVAEGLTNREIAERLFITPGTVRRHMSRIFSKLQITGRVRLAQEVRRGRDSEST